MDQVFIEYYEAQYPLVACRLTDWLIDRLDDGDVTKRPSSMAWLRGGCEIDGDVTKRPSSMAWLRGGCEIIDPECWHDLQRESCMHEDLNLWAKWALHEFCLMHGVPLGARQYIGERAVYDDQPEWYEYVNSQAFLNSYQWRKVRMVVLERDGAVCACCGASKAEGARLNVDHIMPRRLHPDLVLSVDNLQVLCAACNHGKGNWSQKNWRDAQQGGANV